MAAAGFHLFTNPDVGLATLTLLLAIMFFVTGLTECVVAFHVKPEQGWGWKLAGGVVSVLLAIMVWRQFPLSGRWPVGTLVSINLFFSGLTTVMVGSAARP